MSDNPYATPAMTRAGSPADDGEIDWFWVLLGGGVAVLGLAFLIGATNKGKGTVGGEAASAQGFRVQSGESPTGCVTYCNRTSGPIPVAPPGAPGVPSPGVPLAQSVQPVEGPEAAPSGFYPTSSPGQFVSDPQVRVRREWYDAIPPPQAYPPTVTVVNTPSYLTSLDEFGRQVALRDLQLLRDNGLYQPTPSVPQVVYGGGQVPFSAPDLLPMQPQRFGEALLQRAIGSVGPVPFPQSGLAGRLMLG